MNMNEYEFYLQKKGMKAGLQIAQHGFRVYAKTEFDYVEHKQKKLKVDEYNCEKKPWNESVYKPETLSVEADLTSASSKPLKILSTGSFADLRQDAGYYLDKTYFIPKIEDLNVCAILLLRPRCFGKHY